MHTNYKHTRNLLRIIMKGVAVLLDSKMRKLNSTNPIFSFLSVNTKR